MLTPEQIPRLFFDFYTQVSEKHEEQMSMNNMSQIVLSDIRNQKLF